MKKVIEDNHLEEALVAIRRVMRATEINSLLLAKNSQLTPTQHIVLKIIASKKHTTPTHISYITSLRYTTIATVINKLLKRDLITREKGTKDKRVQYLNITEEGMKVLESSPDLLQDKFRDSFSSLNDWEQSMIVSSLQRVARFIDAEHIDAAPIIDYGELNQEPSEFKDLVEEHTTSEDFQD